MQGALVVLSWASMEFKLNEDLEFGILWNSASVSKDAVPNCLTCAKYLSH